MSLSVSANLGVCWQRVPQMCLEKIKIKSRGDVEVEMGVVVVVVDTSPVVFSVAGAVVVVLGLLVVVVVVVDASPEAFSVANVAAAADSHNNKVTRDRCK